MNPNEITKIYENKLIRLQTLYKIKKKKGLSTNLRFNRIQQIIVNDIKDLDVIRHLTIKFRQGGVSTFWLLWWLDETIFRKNINTGILAHKRESLEYLWDIIYYAYDSMPPEIKPKLNKDSAKALSFVGSNSQIFTSLSIRSTTLHNLHISEWCLCDDDEIRATLGAISPYTNVSGESTGHGIGNDGYITYMDAKEKKNEYIARFLPWYLQEEYQLSLNGMDANFVIKNTQDKKGEDELRKTAKRDYDIDITPEQLLYRRETIARQKSLFYQEYPEKEEDAFMVSGDRFFNIRKISTLINELREYKKTNKFAEEGYDYTCFETPNKYDIYCAGADTSQGIDDYNVLKILNVTKRREAFVYRAKCGISKFYKIINYWCGKYYNPLLAVELNNTGHAVILGLRDICHYPNLYKEDSNTRLKVIGMYDKNKIKYGYMTTSKTRPLILSNLKYSIEDDEDVDEFHFRPEFTIYDYNLLSEALTFVKNNDRYEAEQGKKDDVIFTTALAYQMFKKLIGSNKSGGMIGYIGEPSEASKDFSI